MRNYQHWIDGEPVAPSSGAVIERRSPADGRLLATFAAGDANDVDAAVVAARREFHGGSWRASAGNERAAVLSRLADLIDADSERLARIESEETGKTITAARGEIGYGVDLTRYAAALAWTITGQAMADSGPDKLGLVLHEPTGMVALILPWNYPLVCLMQKLPFALAAGCALVIKPSELTSGTTLENARLAGKAGLPNGQLNIVTGTGPEVGAAMTQHPDIDMVSFTGSSAVGKQIASTAAATMKRVALELGGKGANIVFADADLDAAVEGAVSSHPLADDEGRC